jgi:hypothetical protein
MVQSKFFPKSRLKFRWRVKHAVNPAVPFLPPWQGKGRHVVKKFFIGAVLCLMAAPQVAAGQQDVRPVQRVAVSALAASGHPVRAVLRYDLSTAGACRSWSDQPAELCLLLALHVIHMSEHPPKVL